MKIAISPCPNDTYLFFPWIQGFVGQEMQPEPVFADIQQLNEWALEKKFPLIKLSFPCFSKVVHHYQLLPIGAALGLNCGPKIIAKSSFSLTDLPQKKIAIPGKETTAHLLLSRLLLPPKEKIFCPYHEIASLIETNTVDCGLIIHESRFTFQEQGFCEIADLGTLWHAQTHALLPLGGLAIDRDIPDTTKKRIVAILQEALSYAHNHPEKGLPFILNKALEKNPSVVKKHIQTYVTEETQRLSPSGIQAIETFLKALPHDWLYHN